jgi:two-component system KDP operon response regulator KdpE
MAGIRRKLEPDPGHPRYFVTSPGLGLMFLADGTRTLADTGSED